MWRKEKGKDPPHQKGNSCGKETYLIFNMVHSFLLYGLSILLKRGTTPVGGNHTILNHESEKREQTLGQKCGTRESKVT